MSAHENHHYNPRLQLNAKALRSRMTKAEACLWKYVLKGRRLKGYQFRRQRPIDQYIADFVCLPLNLIIEVDGITHTYGEVANNDEIRQAKLESLGFRVIRFEDDEVLTQINRVREVIQEVIEQIERDLSSTEG
ncbi:endonuclease domain-containing protein [Roseivirga sp.]|uniref:endonuclease domain-containing protein n=1 Tax=Roseivirga sp. TaxID=1964215 RepID=UPI003B52928F